MTGTAVRGQASRRDWKVRRAKAASRLRRRLLGLLMKLPGGHSDPASLLARFPDEALLPLRRNGLDPVPALSALRDRQPVSRMKMPLGLRGWLVTGYDENRAVLAADPSTFSNDFGNMIGKVGIAAEDDPGGLGFADPPHHTKLRQLLQPHFTTRAVAAREARVREIIDEALDDMAREGAGGATIDLQRLFALQIPSRVIMELLGVPETERAEFQRLSAARFHFEDGVTHSFDVIQEAIKLLQRIVEQQRVEPGTGLIGQILREHGDEIDDVTLAGLADGVLTGGLETTVSMLALGAVVLLQRPDLAQRLRDDDAAAEPFAEELLRHLTVVQVGFPRFAVRDVEIGGQQLFEGDVVLPSLSAANRDPRKHSGTGPDFEAVDIDRPAMSHLAFGHGLHRCVGAELARMELRVAYPALARRFPELKLAVPADQLRYRDLSFVYGLEELPVTVA
ncbi:MAG: cytochrome P450 [Jatrophihabitans sp.]|uniref:cytochrome P450 n=1 Tax=Jatrophihabitans sp. TaxID=1932789 RepID=UPI003F80E9BB